MLGKRSVTPYTAMRLARFFSNSERSWLGLQSDYDLEETRRTVGDRIRREVRRRRFVA